MKTKWTVPCAVALGAAVRLARADELPAPIPPDPPAGAARVALGLPNPLRTARFDMAASGLASGSAFGSSSVSYVDLHFAFVPRWAFVDTAVDWAWVGAKVAWDVVAPVGPSPLGNDASARIGVDDVEIHAAYSRTLVRDARGDQLLLGPRAGLAFPASPVSRDATILLRTSLGLGLDAHVPIFRGYALPGILFFANGTWEHQLAKTSYPTQIGAVPITTLGGMPPLGLGLLDQNNFFTTAAIPGGGQVAGTFGSWLTIYRDLSLGTAMGFTWQYRPSLCIPATELTGAFMLPSECFSAGHPVTTVFDVAVGYAIADVVWLAFGYDNSANIVHGTGTFDTSFVSSPAALFYGQLSVLFDGVFARASTPPPPPPPP